MRCVLYCAALLACVSVATADKLEIARVDDHVFRGKQPRTEDFPELAKMGIRTVLDLRGGPIHAPRERKAVEAAGMRYASIRLSGLFAPSYQQIGKIMAVLQDADEAPVFVHCRRGDDRVGLVIACYRMVHNHWTNAQALDEARSRGISRFEVLMQRYIRHFDPSRIPSARP